MVAASGQHSSGKARQKGVKQISTRAIFSVCASVWMFMGWFVHMLEVTSQKLWSHLALWHLVHRSAMLKLVSWCFEPSQPQRITSGLNTNFTLSPSYSFHKSCFLSLFTFHEHSTWEPASSRVTYFILWAYTGTSVSHSQHMKKLGEVLKKKCRWMDRKVEISKEEIPGIAHDSTL